MSDTRVTPSKRVIGASLLPPVALGAVASTSPTANPTADVVSTASPPKLQGASAAPTAGIGRKGAAALKQLFENELRTLADRYRARYGAAVVKKQDHGWDVDKAEAETRAAIAAIIDPTRSQDAMVADFQLLAHKFINAMNDYHVNMALLRTSEARLPFRIRPIEGRYAVSSVDREKLPESDFPFQEGDEVLEIDGKPITEAVTRNLAYLPRSNAKADDAAAATMLTVLRGRVAEPLPSEQTRTIKFKRADGKVLTHDLAWNVTSERINPKPVGSGILNIRGAEAPRTRTLDMTAHRFVDQEAIQAAKSPKSGAADPFLMGGRKTLLPDLGPIIFRTDSKNPFDAYVYRTPEGKNVGVIRISSFDVDDPDAAVEAFAELIEKFEATTDALVIDQQNNPGGYFHYMMALLSMLSTEPLKMPKQQEKITPQEAFDADELLEELKAVKTDAQARKVLGKTIAGYPVTLDLAEKMRGHARHIKAEFDAGKDFTDAFPLTGIGVVNPSTRATYSKPILCLVNATCYSCGDFFPSALQQNKRALIMGETTAGAGGYVIREKWLNKVGIDFVTITGSVADLGDEDPSRVENPIEGRGVKPEVTYSPTFRDLREDGADMKEAVNRTITGMIATAGR